MVDASTSATANNLALDTNNGNTSTVASTYDVTFSEPESVLGSNPAEYLGVFYNEWEGYYEPPVSRDGLSKLFLASPHHSSCRTFYANMLCKFFKGSGALDYLTFRAMCMDFASFGDCYLQRIYNSAGITIGLKHQPALRIRKGKNNRFSKLLNDGEIWRFKKDEIISFSDYDISQTVYGWPAYIALIQSVLLNEAATLFRRRYFVNGAHMGYIFFTNDPDLEEDEAAQLKEQISKSKGVGNFKSMFIHVPGGDENSVKLIPVGDKSTQDNFGEIKQVSQNDILTAWRMPGELAGVQPNDKSGRGDAIKAAKVYVEMEIFPVLPIFETVNLILPNHLQISFDTPKTGIWED